MGVGVGNGAGVSVGVGKDVGTGMDVGVGKDVGVGVGVCQAISTVYVLSVSAVSVIRPSKSTTSWMVWAPLDEMVNGVSSSLCIPCGASDCNGKVTWTTPSIEMATWKVSEKVPADSFFMAQWT